MSSIFNYDNRFFQGFNKVVDCFYISILWVIFCIPVVTAGAATTAMYYTVHKVLRGSRGYVWSSFWSSFKSNFKQSTIMWLICLVAWVIMYFDSYLMRQMLEQENKLGFLYYVFVVLMAFLILWGTYIFTYTARFSNTIKHIMKNSAIIAVANLPRTLLVGVILLVSYFLIYIMPVLILLIPGLTMWLLNAVLEKVYRKYMSEEDLENEKQLEMEEMR